MNMTTDQVQSFFRKLHHECGFRISSLKYWYTIATDLMMSPEQNLYVAQKLLGHTDNRVTLEYNVEMLRNCVEKRY